MNERIFFFFCPLTPPCPSIGRLQGCWACVRKLTGRKLPSLGQLQAMRRTDLVNIPICGFIQTVTLTMCIQLAARLGVHKWTWAKRPQEQTGNSTVSWPGKPITPPGFRGFRGRIGWRQTSVGSSGEKGEQPHHRRHPPLDFSHFSRCPESYKGLKSAPTAVRQVGRREINQNRPLWWNNTSKGRHGGTNRAGAAVTVSGSAEQENVQGSQASLRPKINSEK